ncbi:HAD hydrolase family protein [Paenalcaligenes niemegkensis]|uniref:KdsC family phosphatase n=1 Tax=Paenalcaligenes niemegkensis TaxID=2895469 RepID=UPI001EE893BF|nr:HAD family hydrolase [Paenalcaligenes niemegkensis]MCQ9615561.1 HAD hydrolase family protein [Paenalcaligenes niemegkensis]
MSNTLTPQHPAEALLLAKISSDVQNRLRDIRLMVFDVDGVLTDGRLWYNEHGEVFKSFHALDGHGLRLLDESGIRVALITGREGPIVARRAAELGIAEVHQGVRNKADVLHDMAQRLGLGFSEIGYMGDDIIDITAMQRVGFAASVPNAPTYISQITHWVSSKPGGSGAARECCDLILASQHKLGAFLNAKPLSTTGAIQ